ncbi:MAG: Type secretion system pilin [Candidatus Parcubacteria bacterium]|jgi:uncharacterized membrane protein
MAIILIAALAFLALPHAASAAGQIGQLMFLGDITATDLISNVIRSMFGIAGTVALISFVYGGFVWMTAQGDAKKVEKAKDIIKNSVIGLFVMFFSYSALNYVIDILAHA